MKKELVRRSQDQGQWIRLHRDLRGGVILWALRVCEEKKKLNHLNKIHHLIKMPLWSSSTMRCEASWLEVHMRRELIQSQKMINTRKVLNTRMRNSLDMLPEVWSNKSVRFPTQTLFRMWKMITYSRSKSRLLLEVCYRLVMTSSVWEEWRRKALKSNVKWKC